MNCPCVYIGETGRILQKRKAAVKKNDPKNAIAVHAWANQHQVNWEAASVKQEERIYCRRSVLEALHIHQQHLTSNLDCGLNINATSLPKVTPPDPPPNQNTPLYSLHLLNLLFIHPTIIRCLNYITLIT